MANAKDKANGRGAAKKSGTTSNIPGAKVVGKAASRGSAKDGAADKAPKGEGKATIRGTILQLLEQGKGTEEIAKVIQDTFPGSKAAEKPSQHIAYYRSKKKAGK